MSRRSEVWRAKASPMTANKLKFGAGAGAQRLGTLELVLEKIKTSFALPTGRSNRNVAKSASFVSLDSYISR